MKNQLYFKIGEWRLASGWLVERDVKGLYLKKEIYLRIKKVIIVCLLAREAISIQKRINSGPKYLSEFCQAPNFLNRPIGGMPTYPAG